LIGHALFGVYIVQEWTLENILYASLAPAQYIVRGATGERHKPLYKLANTSRVLLSVP